MVALNSVGFISGCFVLLMCSILSSSAGIGGGALNVPVLLSVFGYDYKQAVVLSTCVVLGNVLSQLSGKYMRVVA